MRTRYSAQDANAAFLAVLPRKVKDESKVISLQLAGYPSHFITTGRT